MRKKKWVKSKASKPTVRKMIKAALNRNIETKQSVFTNTDGQQILHNDFINCNSELLQTGQGTSDPTSTNINNRVGDEINLRGVSIKMMLELNERYSDVTFRIMVVKGAKGDTPNRATMFNGTSGNKMLDTFANERFTLISQKYVKLKAPNQGSWGINPTLLPYGAAGPLSGTVTANDGLQTLSRATRIVKMWIPGGKFVRGGKIKYENGTTQVKFYDYNLLVYAYSNYSTFQDEIFVGRVNDTITQMYFKDA